MRIITMTFLSFLAVILPGLGDDRLATLTVGATTYSNVLILRVTGTDIYFSSANGIGNAKLTNLDSTLQAKFAPYAAKAAEVEQTQATGQRRVPNAALAAQQAVAPVPDSGPDSGEKSATAYGDASSTNQHTVAKSFLGKKGPELAVEKWISASPNMNGKFLLVEFWSPSSISCVNFVPTLNHYQQEFGEKLAIVAIADEPEDAVRKIADPNIEYASAIDTQKRMESAVEVKSLPYVLLLMGLTGRNCPVEGNPMKSGKELNDGIVTGILGQYTTAQ